MGMEEKIKKSNSENCKNKNAFLDFANFSCVKNPKDFEIVTKMGAKILIDQEHFLDFSKFPVTQNFQKCCLSINHFVTSARVKQQTNFADAFTWTQNGQKKSTWCFLHFFPEITRHLTEVGPLMIFYHRQVTINLSGLLWINLSLYSNRLKSRKQEFENRKCMAHWGKLQKFPKN